MPALPHSARSSVERFAESMGLTARENSDGSFGFDFAESGRLSILAAQDGQSVIVSLTRRIMLEDVVPLCRVAAAAGYDAPTDQLIQAGLTKADQPVLAITVPPSEFDLPRLDAAFMTLNRIFADLGA